ncbi:MAG: c-type cytochrome [Acidobacteriota bacterium]|nr:c-type cytochrome [Acidobacteriota bacterium]
MTRARTLIILAPAAMLALAASGCGTPHPAAVEAQPKPAAWTAPDPASIPAGPVGDSIRLGASIFEETPKYAAAYVGNRMNCNDCHIAGGTAAWSAPMVGLPGLFPMYNDRSKRVISLEDRIQDCFLRSENGHRLSWNGPEMIALVAYIQWLSQKQPAGVAFKGRGLEKLPDLHADAGSGAGVYSKQCAGCHGADGAGKPPILPALWGPDAFNQGAGMNQVKKMAAFVHHNMPQNHPGTLTPQEAYDVAAYVAGKPHSPFVEPETK